MHLLSETAKIGNRVTKSAFCTVVNKATLTKRNSPLLRFLAKLSFHLVNISLQASKGDDGVEGGISAKTLLGFTRKLKVLSQGENGKVKEWGLSDNKIRLQLLFKNLFFLSVRSFHVRPFFEK